MVKMLKPRIKIAPARIKTADLTVSANLRTRGHKWMRIRNGVFQRDNGLCQTCMRAGRFTVAEEVDHIVRLADGGTDADDNLASICKPCHAIKTAAEASGTHLR